VSRRGEGCGCSGGVLTVKVPRCHNVAVGDGVLDVPPLVCRWALRQMTLPYGIGAVRYVVLGRALRVLDRRHGGNCWISGGLCCRGRCPQRPVPEITALLSENHRNRTIYVRNVETTTFALKNNQNRTINARDAEGSVPYNTPCPKPNNYHRSRPSRTRKARPKTPAPGEPTPDGRVGLTQNPAANQTRDVEDAVPYGSPKATGTHPHRKDAPTTTTTPAVPGHASTSSTTCGSDRSSTVLPDGTPTAVCAHRPADLSL
jgi:hypothetical protein